jgi:hypothetical protein
MRFAMVVPVIFATTNWQNAVRAASGEDILVEVISDLALTCG